MSDEAEKDEFRSLYQKLPLDIYDRLIVQLGRVALANGISISHFLDDDKSKEMIGPRILTWELLVILLENSGNESLRSH